MKSVPISESIKFGWQKTKENFGLLLGVMITIFASSFTLTFISESLAENHFFLSMLFQLASFLITSFLAIGQIIIVLKICNNEEVSFKDLFSGGNLVLSYILATILQGIMIFGGTLLLIIPGIIISIMTSLYNYALINEHLGPIEAIKRSMKLTKGVRLEIFLFIILTCLINLLGALCLIVGIFVTAPISLIAFVYVYKELAKQEDNKILIE